MSNFIDPADYYLRVPKEELEKWVEETNRKIEEFHRKYRDKIIEAANRCNLDEAMKQYGNFFFESFKALVDYWGKTGDVVRMAPPEKLQMDIATELREKIKKTMTEKCKCELTDF